SGDWSSDVCSSDLRLTLVTTLFVWRENTFHSECGRLTKRRMCRSRDLIIRQVHDCQIQRSRRQTDFRSTLSNEEHSDWAIKDGSGFSAPAAYFSVGLTRCTAMHT